MASQTGHIHPAGTSASIGLSSSTIPLIGDATTALTDIIDIELPTSVRGASNDTKLSSLGAVMESSPGWGKPGEGKLTTYLMEAQHATLMAFHTLNTILTLAQTFPVAPGQTVGAVFMCRCWLGEGKISKAEEGSDDKYSVEYALQMTGDASFAPGS